MPPAIKYLLDMKRLPLLLLMLAGGIFLTIRTLGTENPDPPTKYQKILQSVGEMLRQGHFDPQEINDDFSKKVYHKYFGELDPDKNILLQEDIRSLRKYETRLDDEMTGAP